MGIKAAIELHHSGFARDGSFFLHEEGKLDHDVGFFSFESFSHSIEHGREGLDGDFLACVIEDFQESAHVGAFEFAGEINGEGEVADGVLPFVGSVENDDGEFDFAHADFVDGDIALIGSFLYIGEGGGVIAREFHVHSRVQHCESILR